MLGALFVLIGCEKEEPVVLPNLEIVNATQITNNAATLQAKILEKGTAEIIEFGFIWQANGEPFLDNPATQKVILDTPVEEGAISATISGLQAGTAYSYKAFVSTQSDTYTSMVTSFQTQTPLIESISPAEGIQDTEVTLTGQYFSSNPDQVKVFVEGEAAEVTAASETQLTFIMPENTPGNVVVQVEVNGVRSTEAANFNYLYSFTLRHHEVRAGKTVVVNVFNSSQGNTYKIGGIEAKQAWTWLNDGYREIGVEVPASLPPGETTIEVFDTDGNPLANAHPDPLTIIPSGTWAKKQDVDVGGYYKTVGFVVNGKGYVIAGDKVHPYDQDTDSWSAPATIDFLSNSFFYLNAFIIEGDAYILADTELYRFDPATLSLEVRQSFPGAGKHYLISFSDGNHLFTGLGYYYSDTNEQIAPADFWKYQPSSDTWMQLADLPSSIHYANPAPVAAYLHGKGYIFGLDKQVVYDTKAASTLETDVMVDRFEIDHIFTLNNRLYYGRDTFYEFDPSKEIVLEESTSAAVSANPRFTLIFEDKAYVGVAKDGTPAIELWKFTPGW